MTTRNPAMQDIRSRTRELMRAELASAAVELFVERGFNNVTIEDIAAAAGVSRRTFFRYFPTKEDAVVGQSESQSFDIAAALEERPEDEPVWDSLRMAACAVLQRISDDPDGSLRIYQMLEATPDLQAARGVKHRKRQELLHPVVRQRLLAQGVVSRARADMAASALLGAAMSCYDTALRTWSASDGKRNAIAVLDSVMALVGELTTVSLSQAR
jgi:AcrR family transcriptional regulator